MYEVGLNGDGMENENYVWLMEISNQNLLSVHLILYFFNYFLHFD